jgi:uncharacterized damage-inducible protein DinB
MAASRRRRPFVISEALLRAYSASARVNQYLVEHLDPGVWRAKPPGGGRTIAALVAHLHNCGLVYLRRAPGGEATPGELNRFRVTVAQAARALGAKRRAVLQVLARALAGDGRVDGFRYDAAAFLAYYMIHDGHHRGQIMMQARLLGHPLSQKVMSGMWMWEQRVRE